MTDSRLSRGVDFVFLISQLKGEREDSNSRSRWQSTSIHRQGDASYLFFSFPLSRPFHFLPFAVEARCPASLPLQSSIRRQGRVAPLRSCHESKMNPIISHVHTRARSARFPFRPENVLREAERGRSELRRVCETRLRV